MNKVLFWDFDGTLVYSESLWTGSVYNALLNHIEDTDITIEDIRPYMRTGFTWHSYNSDHTSFIERAWWEQLEKHFCYIFTTFGIDEKTAENISKDVRDIILDVSKYNLYEDTILALQGALDKGYCSYIISNNYPELDQTLEKLNLDKYFKDYIISGKIGYDKPRKEIFDAALKISGKPDKCFMIGDNPIADIIGAKNMGIPAILVHRDAISNADYKFDNLKDILNVI